MESANRNAAIDIYKGIGIILVMMGHIGFGDLSSYIAHAFHMPMFFLVSGFLYHRKEEIGKREWIWQKAISLLCPYFIFGFINYGIFLIMQLIKKQSLTIDPIIHLFSVNTTGLASGSLWFFTALLVSNILFFIINQVVKNYVLLGIIVFSVSYTGIWMTTNLPTRLPYAIDAGMVGLGLFYVGYLLKIFKDRKRIQQLLELSPGGIALGVILFSVLILNNGEINMRKGLYHNSLLFWINAIGGSILVFSISAYCNGLKDSSFPILKWLIRLVQDIGKYSMMYVCMNDLACAETKYFLKCIFNGDSKLNTIAVHSATLIIAVIVIEWIIHYTPVTKWMNRIKEILCAKIKL